MDSDMNPFGLPFPPDFDLSQLLSAGPGSGPVNWAVARNLAISVAGDADAPRRWEDVEPEYDGLVRAAEMLVSQYTELSSSTVLTPVEVVSRAGWVERSVEAFQPLVEPLAEKLSAARAAEAAQGAEGSESQASIGGWIEPLLPLMLGAQAGMLAGMVSHHVLGRYDLQLPPPAGGPLVFVGPNLEEAERNLNVVPRDFKFWIAMREVAHALVFAQPGVRETFESLACGVTEAFDIDPESLGALRSLDLQDPDTVQRLMDDPSSVLGVVSSPAQEAALEEMEAFVGFVEGYCAHVMDAVGSGNIPNLRDIEDAIETFSIGRRDETADVFAQLFGFDMRRRQVEQPKRFCDAVVTRSGIAALNRVWGDPLARPSLRELDDPDGWLARQL